MGYLVRKVFRFEAAHRLIGSYSEECQNIHGHSYKVEVFLYSQHLNDNGMVIDFKEMKNMFAGIIADFDHKIILHEKDKTKLKGDSVIRVNYNPTAENMAKYFYDCIGYFLTKEIPEIYLDKVRVHETENGYAEYMED